MAFGFFLLCPFLCCVQCRVHIPPPDTINFLKWWPYPLYGGLFWCILVSDSIKQFHIISFTDLNGVIYPLALLYAGWGNMQCRKNKPQTNRTKFLRFNRESLDHHSCLNEQTNQIYNCDDDQLLWMAHIYILLYYVGSDRPKTVTTSNDLYRACVCWMCFCEWIKDWVVIHQPAPSDGQI